MTEYEKGYKDGMAGAALPNIIDNGDKIDGYAYSYKTDSDGVPYINIDCVRAMLTKATDHRQLAEWLTELKEAKRLLQAAEKTIDDYCRGYCECCKNRDFELARCGLVNGCRDKDNWEWILGYRVKELFKEG